MENSVHASGHGGRGPAIEPDALAWYLDTITRQLQRVGITRAVVCPGSRSTPLVLALDRTPAIHLDVLVDERSAGFYALGLARARRQPIVLVSTSGTAAANFFPAVVEASFDRVPLIVLTADRPRELRGVGASQTIDQVKLYGTHVRYFIDLPSPEPLPAVIRYVRNQVLHAVRLAQSPVTGPVHLNLPLREPLLPDWERVPDGPPALPLIIPETQISNQCFRQAKTYLGQFPRGIVVAGPGSSDSIESRLVHWAHSWGWPILADPLSNLRHGNSPIITAYDLILRTQKTPTPDAVLRIGAIPTSKALNQLMVGLPGVYLDPSEEGRDPNAQDLLVVGGDVGTALATLANPPDTYHVDTSWISSWQHAEQAVRGHLEGTIEALGTGYEPQLFFHLGHWLTPLGPSIHPVMVSNSMPIRDLDTFSLESPSHLRFFANRGANGIDGVTSTALGLAAHYGDVTLIIGDLAFYHDMNGLLAASRLHLNALIIVINNQGGGIFSFLPQHEALSEETFESYFGTPISLDFRHVASLYQGAYERVTSVGELGHAMRRFGPLPGLRIIEWQTVSRDANREAHQAIVHGMRLP